jgi:hypothetical protein
MTSQIISLTRLFENMDINNFNDIDKLSQAFDNLSLYDIQNKNTVDLLTKAFNKLDLDSLQCLEDSFASMKITNNKVIITTKYGKDIVIILSCHTNFVKKNPLYIPIWLI